MKTSKFKMTEIGEIPADWEVKRLGNVAPLKRGFDLPTSHLQDGPYPVVYSNGIGAYHNKAMCSAPGLITGRSGTIGKFTYIESGRYWPHNTALWVTSFNGNAPLFLKYLYSTLKFEDFSTGTGVPTLNRNNVHEYRVAIPPLAEQKAIAEALSDVDELLAAMTTLIEKKRSIKQGAMQELLTGKKRLVGFKNSESSCLCASVLKKDAGVVEGDFNTETQRRRCTEFKMTEIGLIPEDWEVKPLSSIGIFSKGSGISRSEANSGVLPCVRYGEIYTDHNDYIKEFKSFISESVAINAKRLVDGDILFAGSGETKEEIGKAVAYLGGAERVYCGGDILVLSPFSDFDSKFLGYVCNSQAAVSQKSARGQGDAVVHIRTSNLAEVLIPIPPLPEQKAIAEVLSDMDAEIEALEAKRAKYESIKQGMMQELLTGKTRLKGV